MRFDSVIILAWISTIGLTWLLLFGEKSKQHPISKVLKRNFLGKANNIKASFFINNKSGRLDYQKQPPDQRCYIKKGVLKYFAKFKGKRLCQSLLFNKVAGEPFEMGSWFDFSPKITQLW